MEVRVQGRHARVVRDGQPDEVAVEEPLEIRVDGRPLVVTMRTPGEDEELAAGFLYGEGLLAAAPGFHPCLDANAVAGLANRILAYGADRILLGFPNALAGRHAKKSTWVGNPLRDSIAQLPPPAGK